MKQYVGIDLGTTNSVICSFDGENVRLHKNPEQHDVTPSAIFIDKRGNRYVGMRAYNNAAKNPDNAATLFKRLMGTNTPIKFSAVNVTMTPEECSAEILRALFGYLPEEMRKTPETGTVITVPAAFNQMQRDATMSAAALASFSAVALMQEPVAAVMSIMRHRKADGIFLVYDLGGGTLDVAIAESISGHVNLLAHGGIAMCGGRDFDRVLFDNIVKPWLLEKFELPDDFVARPEFKPLIRMATWATEKAKIDLSSKEATLIGLPESELNVKDRAGADIYLDLAIQRDVLDSLIAPRIEDSVQAARETLEKVGLSPHDVERVVFVGGPTNYKPLRDRVAFQLGIAASTDVNPMTAVAEGAAVFAESIDWNSENRTRKSARQSISPSDRADLAFNYISRTPGSNAKITVAINGPGWNGAEFQVDSLDTGWSSGRAPLRDAATIDVPLPQQGENTFKVFVFEASGGAVSLRENKIIITRTAATIDGIPASSSIGVEVLEKLGGKTVLDYLVREGEPLPKEGRKTFRAAESLRGNTSGSLHFRLWEGEIEGPVADNRLIGTFSISGRDFDDGTISAGAELVCDYQVLDSGNVVLEITVPSVGGTFHSGRNFYSRQAGQIDYTKAAKRIHEEAEVMRSRIDAVSQKIDDVKLEHATGKLDEATTIPSDETDPELAKQAMDNVLEARRLLARVRQDHRKEIRQLDLDQCLEYFRSYVKEHARQIEISAFENLARTAQRAIDNNSSDFESNLEQLQFRNFEILWRQDWFVVNRFKWLLTHDFLFPDKDRFTELVANGSEALKADQIDKLRKIVAELDACKIRATSDDEMLAEANIVRA